MFRLDEIAPDIAAKLERERREQADHEASCRAETCERCGRYPRLEPPTDAELRATWAGPALATLPAAFAGATLDAPWLGPLVGADALRRARGLAGMPDSSAAAGAPSSFQGAGATLVASGLRGAVFVGPAGAGKTSLAVAAFRALVEGSYVRTRWDTSRARHRYTSAHALAKARAMHPLGEGESPLVLAALSAPLLLIDELGGEDPRYASAVTEVLYERHAEGRPTWVTTGVGPSELATRYGGGIARRLFEGAEVFRLQGRRR